MATKERIIIENMLCIADKAGKDVDFKLNPIQARLDNNLTGRDIIPKARQMGVSTYFLARYLTCCLARRNTRAVVISHDKETTQRALSRVHYMINHMKGPPPVISHASKSEITFPKMDSAFYIGTAGTRKFGRGDTITHLHCSEIAYWPDPKTLVGGLFQAVPLSGEIAIESTGNGVGDYYHRRCMRAAAGQSGYRLHFFDWQSFPEYTMQLTMEQERAVLNNLDPDLEEPRIRELFGLTAGQIVWRRQKIDDEFDGDLSRFKQDYPMTLDECFQASGHSIFQRINYVPSPAWVKASPEMYILQGHPEMGSHKKYLIGADVGAGVGSDNSTMFVICIDTGEQVASWVSNKLAPDVFAGHLAQIGLLFKEAFIVVESNNHGILTLAELRKMYPAHLIFRDQASTGAITEFGHRTTVITKPMMVGKLRQFLVRDWIIHDPLLSSELSTFVEKEDGKLEAQAGCLDDRVVAAAKAAVVFERAALVMTAYPEIKRERRDPFLFDNILNEMHRGRSHYPISDHLATDQNEILVSLGKR